MKALPKYLLHLLLLNAFLILSAYLLGALTEINFDPSDTLIISLGFSIISIISIVIFFRGQARGPESQTLHSMAGIALKFILDMVLAVIWFVAAKKNSLPSLIMFFVIYLTLTLLLVFNILKTLKDKSL